MILSNAQSIIAKDRHRFRVVNCGRRFGKTTLAVLEMVAKAVYGNDRQICYIAPTYAQARDIAWQELKRVSLPAINKVNESRLEITLNTTKGGTSTISLRGWESIETLRGQKFDFIVVDEIASMRNWNSNWEEVIRPTLTDKKGEVLFISTPKGFNHFYDLYNKQDKDTDYKSFHYTSYDNPNIPSEEIDKAKSEITEDRFAQEYLADFRKTEGLVFKEFRRDYHIYNTDSERQPRNIISRIAGVDFGFTNPTAVISILKDFDGTYWVDGEWYKRGKTDTQVAEYVSALNFNEVYPDPESPSAIQQMLNLGINCKEVVKNKDSIKNGIDKVRALFLQKKLFIHSSCENLISELETYAYAEKRPDHNENENPIKENDHACFTKDTKIEIPVGEKLYQVSTGLKNVYEFMGSKVTADHPYLTQRGFVVLDSLRYSDRIVVWKNKLLTELRLDDTQSQNAVSLKTILYLLLRNLQATKLNASTGIYGKNTMEKYQKVSTYTILTTIQLITIYLTSNLYHLKNIAMNITRKTCLDLRNKWNTQGSSLLNGTRVISLKSFTSVLPNFLGRTSHWSKETATNVVKNTKRHFQRGVNSATIIAKLKHLGKEEVFATTTTSGFFLANGVVVSNCDALRYALFMDEPTNVRAMYQQQDRIVRNRSQKTTGE